MTRNRAWAFGFGALLFLVAVVATTARVERFRSDPRATLLVTEAILKTGGVKLDVFGKPALARYTFAVHEKNGHSYGYFPLGSSVLALPFVAVTDLFGVDVTAPEGRFPQFLHTPARQRARLRAYSNLRRR